MLPYVATPRLGITLVGIGVVMRMIQRGVKTVTTNHHGPYLGQKPRSVQFGENKKLSVNDWTDMLQKMCDLIASENETDFSLVLSRIKAERAPYFGRRSEMGSEPRPYPIGRTGISVRCNLFANNIFELCDALSRVFGYGPITVVLR